VLTDLLTRGAAARLKMHKGGAGRLIMDIYQEALVREPTPAERTTAGKIVGDPMTADGVADLLWIVVMLPEFSADTMTLHSFSACVEVPATSPALQRER